MNPHYLVVAFGLISSPEDVPVPPLEDPVLLKCVQQQALGLEILDPREQNYVAAKAGDWEQDVQLLRHRYQSLRDAPRLGEVDRFPDKSFLNEAIGLNRAWGRGIEDRKEVEFDRLESLRRAEKDGDAIYRVLDKARDARCPYYYVSVRREALKELKKLLGDENYANGRLPGPVPTAWCVKE